MIKNIAFIFLSFLSFQVLAQNRLTVVDTQKLSAAQMKNIQQLVYKDGWVHIIHQGEHYVTNYSNRDYTLFFSLKCQDPAGPPYFLIEYSDNYGDGTYGGIDLVSSRQSNGQKITFTVDGTSFGNPFQPADKKGFSRFVAALKKGKSLRIKIDPDRDMQFKLAHPEFLDIPVKCR